MEVGANTEKMLYAKKLFEIRKIRLLSTAICNIVVMFAAILKRKANEFGVNVDKMLKSLVQIREIKFWSASVFNIAAMLAVIVEKQVDENRLGTGRILYAKIHR